METQKNDEKNIMLELKRQLGRMMVQVDYMYRNDREMSQLDLDVMMERTRDVYQLLCDYQAESCCHSMIDENVVTNHNSPVNTEINEGGELINRDVEFEIETPTAETKNVLPDNEPDINGEDDEDAHGVDFKEVVEEEITENVEESNDSVDEEIDDEDWEDDDDEMFHIEPVEEKKANEPEDNSLAARLQRTPVTDIRMALGINDKMMIINDLFKGSVERYNKSIDALNEFPTLSGARIYMSELQIELQWDVESPAYKMLYDLVERRFI